jgi:hypothetical protein
MVSAENGQSIPIPTDDAESAPYDRERNAIERKSKGRENDSVAFATLRESRR